jgi:hypothetical protein
MEKCENERKRVIHRELTKTPIKINTHNITSTKLPLFKIKNTHS